MKIRFSKHALEEMKRREIPPHLVTKVIDHPDQMVKGHGKAKILQSQVTIGGNLRLLRVVVGTEEEPHIVVTVYKTSQIKKYWENR